MGDIFDLGLFLRFPEEMTSSRDRLINIESFGQVDRLIDSQSDLHPNGFIRKWSKRPNARGKVPARQRLITEKYIFSFFKIRVN